MWSGRSQQQIAKLFVVFEEEGDEFIEVSAPDAPVVGAVGNVGDVLDFFVFEGSEESGVGVEEKILFAAADPEQFEAGVRRVGVVKEGFVFGLVADGGTEGADVSECVEVAESYGYRLAAAH